MKEGLTELVIILDASGSMFGSTNDVIGGYNSLIDKQKKLKKDANVTLVLFNSTMRELYFSKPIDEVGILTTEEYNAIGTTALYDAIGFTMDRLVEDIVKRKDEEKPEKIMMVIMTDGYENCSRDYLRETIKTKLEEKEEEGWDILFVGANIDTFKEGSKIGVNVSKAANYKQSSDGIKSMYMAVDKAVTSVRETGNLDRDWAENLRE